LLEARIEELKDIRDIGDTLAHKLKERVEKYIEDNIERQKANQVRLVSQMKKNPRLIEGLYELHGDDFTRHVTDMFRDEFGLDAEFIGEEHGHEPDILIQAPEGNITVESKRKEKGKVSANESEEILGKGAKYNPIANVTIGYPDFVEVAKTNATSTNITLLPATTIGEILIRVWKNETNTEKILSLLRTGRYLGKLEEYYL